MHRKINVALVGVGSFAKALIEGVAFYTKNPTETSGLAHEKIGNYYVRDIDFVCAFDVDKRKVGQKLCNAVFMAGNVTKNIVSPLKYNALVYRGPTLDGVVNEMKGTFVNESEQNAVNVAHILKERNADILVNFLPSGSDKATNFYAEEALKANCSFVNCIPSPLATVRKWRKRFEEKGLVLLGDDIKSQVGATMLNRILLHFFKARGVRITKTYQENRGSNADHFNLLYRSKQKEKSKSEALRRLLEKGDAKPTVKFFYTGKPSGHKVVRLQIEGEIFGRTPITINARIEDEISFNGAGMLVDAIRAAKLLVDSGKQREAINLCPYLMKTPPKSLPEFEAIEAFSKLIN